MAATAFGIGEGLMPIALGLAVGVPAWWVYRYLNACVEEFGAEMAGAALLVLSCVRVRR